MRTRDQANQTADQTADQQSASGDPRVLLQHHIARQVRPLAAASAVGTVLAIAMSRSRPALTDPAVVALTIFALLSYAVIVPLASPERVAARGRAHLWAAAVVALVCANKGYALTLRGEPRDFIAIAVIVLVTSLLTPSWTAWSVSAATAVALVFWFPSQFNDPDAAAFLYVAVASVAVAGVVIMLRRASIFRLAEANRLRLEARTETVATAAQMHSIIEASSDGIVIVGDDGKIAGWNPSAERIFGYERAEILGQPLEVLIPNDLRTTHGPNLQASFRNGYLGRLAEHAIEVEALRKGGSRVHVELGLRGWRSADGRQYFSAAARDVSDRKAAEEARTTAEEARWRQRNALDINEQVIQGLVVSLYALDDGDTDTARAALTETLGSARSMVASTLGDVALGDILRESSPTPTDRESAGQRHTNQDPEEPADQADSADPSPAREIWRGAGRRGPASR